MGGWQPGAPGCAPAPPGTVQRRGDGAHFALGRKQPRSLPGLPQTPASVGCRHQRSRSGTGPHPTRLCLCSRQHFGSCARTERCFCRSVPAGDTGSAPISPPWQKGGDGGVPASRYPGTAPSRHRRSSPTPLSRHSVGLWTRLPRMAGCGPLPKPTCGVAAPAALSNPSASFSPSQPVSPQLCPTPSVHPSACLLVRLSVSLRRARPQRLAGGGGLRSPRQEFSFSLLYFPLLSPLVSGRCSDLDRDFWNNNDNTVQQKWSSYPPKEFILNISPYAPYGDPRLSLK